MADTKVTLVGLAGTNGSGKDTVGQILDSRFNYLFVSVTELLREEARLRGLEVTRENTRLISAEWRRAHGLAVLVDKEFEQFQSVKERYSGLVMASLRNPGEVTRLHELGGKLIWLDADPKVRYQRVIDNSHLRNRQAEDDKTFAEFMAEEEIEMNPPKGGDEATLNGSAVKAKADFFIDNTNLSIEELTSKVADCLGLK